jgi:endonuclease/exonuclease/phosphatase (EEP) superfamily protein YafD
MLLLLQRLVIFGLFALIVMIIAGFAGRVHPLFDSIGHFRLHLLMLLGVGVGVALLLRVRRIAAFSTAVFAVCLFSLLPLKFSGSQTPAGSSALKLVQLNVLFNNQNPDRAANWIREQKPDVVTLQEVSKRSGVVMDLLRADLPHQIDCRFASVGGVAILSRHPIAGSKCLKGEGFVWARVQLNGQDLTIGSFHAHWPYPYRQSEQIDRLEAEFKAMPRPVILAGDFNAAPWSFAVQRVASASETSVVGGLRLTLRMGPPPFGPLPFMPIDHVFAPKEFATQSIIKGPALGSDHHPIVATFSF